MNEKQIKLERPERLEELNPTETLRNIGLTENHIVCDIGAGSGIFTIPAARIGKKVYALEISDEMLMIIREKVNRESISNIEFIKVDDAGFDVEDKTADIALLVTVLHGIPEKTAFLHEVKRILKDTGRLAVLEFHKRETPMGPAVERRLGKEDVIDVLKDVGLVESFYFDLGENFYCLVFEKISI